MTTINGTSGNDELFGATTVDTINGLAGDDYIIGEAGDDSLNGGAGNDTIEGGLGVDVAYYTGKRDDFQFALTSAGALVVIDLNLADGNEGTDILTGVENLQFSDVKWKVTTATEFRVNTTTADNQQNPAITALADGGFVVTWQSNLQDGSGYGVYGQRYNSFGIAAGVEFRINTYSQNDQSYSAITALADGGFVVTWSSSNQDGVRVNGKRYNSLGAVVGGEFRVTTNPPDFSATDITALSDGGFVATWSSGNDI